MPNGISDYLDTVSQQIRWKRAQPMLLSELRTHLLDQMDACKADGMDEPSAEEETLRQMGDPVTVGTELDRVHRPVPQWGLLIFVMALTIAGAILRIWLTQGWEYNRISPVKTIGALVIGFAVMMACYLLDFTILGTYAKPMNFLTIGCAIVLIDLSPRLNAVPYYARYVCLLFPTLFAGWLYQCRGKGWSGLLLAFISIGGLAAIDLLMPYLLGLLILLAVAFVLMLMAAREDWFAIGKRKTLAVILGISTVGMGCILYHFAWSGYARSRIMSFLHPEQDPLRYGFQGMTIRGMLQSAKLFGAGSLTAFPFESDSHAYYELLPNANSDSFFAALIHTLGWIPFLLLIVAFTFMMIWMIHRCLRQKNLLGRMIAVSVVLSLGLQAMLSILLNLGFVLTAVHFPLLIGNLHIVIDLALIGLALSVFRCEKIPMDLPSGVHWKAFKVNSHIRFQDGEIVISLKRKPIE